MFNLIFQAICELSFSFDDNLNKNDKPMFKTNTDYCRVAEGIRSNPIMKVLMEHFGEVTPEHKCPYKKGKYFIKNLKITDISIPIVKDLQFKYYQKMVTKVPGKKGLIHLYTQTYYGNLRNMVATNKSSINHIPMI